MWRQVSANAGSDAVVAAGGSYTLSGATASNFGTLTWIAPSGSFNNANALNSTYTPDLSALKFNNGKATITLTLTAEGLGTCEKNVSSSLQLTILDKTAPVILGLPADMVVDNDTGQCNAKVAWIEPEAFDELSVVRLTSSHKPGDVFPLGTSIVTYIATDDGGNKTEGKFSITVIDKENPIISAPQDLTLETNTSCVVFNVDLGTPNTSDNCGILSVKNDAPVVFGIGTTIVTWTVTDLSGNVSTDVQKITVIDKIAPTVAVKEIAVKLTANGQVTITPEMVDNGSFDNCGIQGRTLDKTTFNESNIGLNKVTLTVTDHSGNQSSASTVVKIEPFDTPVSPSFISGIIYENYDYVVNWGTTDFTEVLPATVSIITGDGMTVELEVDWETENINSFISGLYNINGVLKLNSFVRNPLNIPVETNVVVLPKPLLNSIRLTNNVFEASLDVPNIYVGDIIIEDDYDDIHYVSLITGVDDNEYFVLDRNRLYWNGKVDAPGRVSFTVSLIIKDRDQNIVEKTFTILRNRKLFSEITINNSFTPNGDGKNDTWGVPELKFYENVRIHVFERSGSIVFTTTMPDVRWDGTFKGKALAIGTYFWIIEVGETGEVRKGMLNLLRK